jgi:hypothetical protein
VTGLAGRTTLGAVAYPGGPGPHPQQPPPRRGLTTPAIIAIVAGAVVVVLCLGCLVIGQLMPLDTTTSPPAADAPPGAVEGPGGVPPAATRPPRSSAPVMLTIPDDLVGQNALIAHDRLEKLGFVNIHYASADPEDTFVILPQNWTVTKVEPKAGTKMAADATLVLTCTKRAA